MRIGVTAISLLIMFGMVAGASAADIPRPEHPRPDLMRQAWLNLNGEWDFDFDPDDAGLAEEWFKPGTHEWSKTIVVPFPWESKLSGIQEPDYRGVGWYHRKIWAPADWNAGKNRIFLVFGAIDWSATVWIDGEEVGQHANGYIPFEIDVTDLLADGKEHDLIVRAEDNTDPRTPTGKQINWYTPTSGIWQTVYMEARGASHIDRFKVFPNVDVGSARFEVTVDDPGDSNLQVRAVSPDKEFETVTVPVNDNRASLVVKPKKVTLWTPDTPQLYDLKLQVLSGNSVVDEVATYFAVRSLETGKWQDQPFETVLLNGKPVYIQSALHQSFHPDGIHTYPSDKIIQEDLQLARDSGLNSLRVHIKVEEPRFYYWADKLGVLIWYDLPNFWRWSEAATERFEETLRGSLHRDFNHPSIFLWVLFNETWGLRGRDGYAHEQQKWVRSMYELTKRLDPTRLCEDMSPCNYDHVITDINSWHFYINNYDAARNHIQNAVDSTYPGSPWNYVEGLTQKGRPLLNSEYGGISAGLGDQDISYSLQYLTNLLRGHHKIQGFIYTELTDIEWEHNGLVNYDRSKKEFGYPPIVGPTTVADIFNLDFVVLDGPPIRDIEPGESVTVPVSVSHYSERAMKSPRLVWWIDGMDRSGEPIVGTGRAATEKQQEALVSRYNIRPQKAIRLDLPETPGLYTLKTALMDGEDRRVAVNWMWFNANAAPSPRVEKTGGKTIALRFDPRPTQAEGDVGAPVLRGGTSGKYVGFGDGRISYRMTLPDFIKAENVESIELVMEVAAKAKNEKLDWPERKKNVDYPQTDVRKFPSQVAVSLMGREAGTWQLPDDPADHRGILSHQKQRDPGSYGYLKRATLGVADAPAIREALAAARAVDIALDYGPVPGNDESGGLAVFGENLGSVPVEPTLFVRLVEPVTIPADYETTKSLTVTGESTLRALLPTAEFGEARWKLTTLKPPDDWADPDFNDVGWEIGVNGFGTADTPNSQVRTRWGSSDIWLRWKGDFGQLPEDAPIWIDYYHDEDMEVYANGELLLRRRGYVTQYQTERLSDEQRAKIRRGVSTIAVHCRQTGGGQFVDVGFFTLQSE